VVGGQWPVLKRDTTVESHPFDSAQGRLFRKVRGRMGHLAFGLGESGE